PTLVTFWILLLALILELSSAASISPRIEDNDDDVTRAALSHFMFKRRLGVRLPNLLRISDHRMSKRRLGVRLPNILFQRDGAGVSKKASD
ncbi:hypothetical protein PFISCL1PPCAC_26125, partial [Pristionchus fissidentatus]